jgi:prepilin-type N-terminal cleavage/methylation domain-containing protein
MSRRCRGFNLLETTASLVILSSLAVLGTQLLRTSLRVTGESVNAQETAVRLTSAVGQLRADVWNARAFSSNDDQSLHIEPPQGSPIEWSMDSANLIRVQGSERRRWMGVASNTLFQIDGPSVLLRSKSHGDQEQLRLVSQLQLASRGDQ